MILMLFPPIAFACFCYRGSYFKSRGERSRNFWACCGGRVSSRVCRWCWSRMWQGGVGQGVAEGVVWDVSGAVWSWMWLEGVAEDVAWAVVGSAMVILDRGMGWEVSRRVLGCRWWWSEGLLWKVRVLLVIFDCVGGVLLVEVDCVAGRRCGGCCPGCRWWCLIANVVEGVAYSVSPVWPIGL